MTTAESLIRRYYDCFNARRLQDAVQIFSPAAKVDYLPGTTAREGKDAYLQFATTWLTAFPDAWFEVEDIRSRRDSLYEVDAIATGTHSGTLEFGTWVFRPTHNVARFPVRELIEITNGLVTGASLSFDLQELVRQLTKVDVAGLEQHLTRLARLHEELASAPEGARQRELLDAIGRELDGARRAVRPYFR